MWTPTTLTAWTSSWSGSHTWTRKAPTAARSSPLGILSKVWPGAAGRSPACTGGLFMLLVRGPAGVPLGTAHSICYGEHRIPFVVGAPAATVMFYQGHVHTKIPFSARDDVESALGLDRCGCAYCGEMQEGSSLARLFELAGKHFLASRMGEVERINGRGGGALPGGDGVRVRACKEPRPRTRVRCLLQGLWRLEGGPWRRGAGEWRRGRAAAGLAPAAASGRHGAAPHPHPECVLTRAARRPPAP